MKRNNIYNMVYLLAMLLMFGACQEEDLGGQSMGGNRLTLDLQTSATTTRVPMVGEDRFNENEVKSVDVYFFNDGQQDTENYLYAQTDLVPEGSTLQVELDKNIILDNSTYYIYVVANRQGSDNTTFGETTGQTLADLKQRTVTTHWKEGYTEDESVTEDSFVMDGSTTVTVNPEGTQGHVKLTRAMAKVMLYVTTEDELETGEGDEKVTYTPGLSRMNVTMVYAVNKTDLSDEYDVQADADYITRIRRDYQLVAGTEDSYEMEAPFYSYPNPENTTDRQDSYLIVCVPWIAETNTGQQALNYYYRVPITGNTDPALLERNTYYRINVHIGVLGSLNPNEAVEVENEYEILDWFETPIDADINQYRYLVLDEYNSVMNNVDELEMPYISSSPIDWSPNETGETNDGYYTVIESVSYTDYHQNNSYSVELTAEHPWDSNRQHGYSEETAPAHFSDFELGQGDTENTIKIKHVLDDLKDFVKYTITVSVYNTQGVKADTWTIVQYPARYVVGEKNEEGYVPGDRWTPDRANRFINGYYENGDTPYDDGNRNGNGKDDLGSVSALGGTNSNPNLYTIYISSFEDNTYALGDPRNPGYTDFGTTLDATEYRATSAAAEEIIAPAYKVASSWGKTLPRDYEATVKRCASYQEAGYPAGRWRIPTKAEVEYIIKLSNNKKIPRLFGEEDATTDYWVSSGKYNTSSGYEAGTSGIAYVRCVYDVWYWGEQTIEEDYEHNLVGNNRLTNYDFVWGDAVDGSLTEGEKHN